MKKNPVPKVLSIALLIACLTSVLSHSACSSSESKTTEKPASEEPKYTVQLFVDCASNLLFSKYDVDVKVDGEKVGNIDHGSEATFELGLTKGQHELVFTEEGATEPDGKTSFVVEGEGDKFSYKVSCSSDQIGVESIKDESDAKAQEQEAEERLKQQGEEARKKEEEEIEKLKKQEEAAIKKQREEEKRAEEAARKEQEEAAKKAEEEAKKEAAKNSKYEYACVRRMSNYDLYFLIDYDEMTATDFGTEQSPMVLPCKGDLDNGLTITYENGAFTQRLKFKTPGNDSKLVLTDGNGYDWDYEKADVDEAEKVLAKVS